MNSKLSEPGFQIQDARMIELYKEIYDYAHHDMPCIFFGPSGCGKEYAAAYYYQIWCKYREHPGPYYRVNCSGLTDNIAYRELFGQEKGAYTDAKSAMPGLFQTADKGLLFLDEIADLPQSVQPMLLRAIDPETAWATPMGSRKEYSTKNIRVLAATDQHRDKIRPALLNRLGIAIEIPSLDERPKDRDGCIPYFVNLALRKRQDFKEICQNLLKLDPAQKKIEEAPALISFCEQISADLRPLVRGRTWPGNFRMLRVAIDVAVIRSSPEKGRDDFIHQCAHYFAAHSGAYARPLSPIGATTNHEAPLVLNQQDPLFARLREVMQNLKDTELSKWAEWLHSHPEQMFTRSDLEPFFATMGYRTILNRLSVLVDAGELEQCGPKKQYYRRVQSRRAMPVQRKHADAFLNLPAIQDESVVRPEAVAAVIAMLYQGPHVYLGGPDKSGKTPTALMVGQKLSAERAVYYYRFDEHGMVAFLQHLIERLQQEHLLSETVHPEQLGVAECVFLLTGYLAQFFSGDERPLIILDHVQLLGRQACLNALLIMLNHWSFGKFLLVGTKLDLHRPEAEAGNVVEYTLTAK